MGWIWRVLVTFYYDFLSLFFILLINVYYNVDKFYEIDALFLEIYYGCALIKVHF